MNDKRREILIGYLLGTLEPEESAKIDGANDFTILFRVFIPLSMPVVMVMLLFYGVGNWNAWVDAMLFLRNRSLFPLSLILREILISNNTISMVSEIDSASNQMYSELVKYCIIIVATIPILGIYPIVQRHFIKGVMVGAIKE